MKLKITSTFEDKLFDAYDTAEIDVELRLTASEHKQGTVSFYVTLDIQNRWSYEDESDIELPDAVELLLSSANAYEIEGSGGLTQEFRLPLSQNLLDGLKDFANHALWADEEAYELWVNASFTGPKGEVNESATLALRNPWS